MFRESDTEAYMHDACTGTQHHIHRFIQDVGRGVATPK
jgi:hypothetical protein